MNTDRNLLFGALAFQNEYIDLAQFAAVCRAWAEDKVRPMADLLVERGWITIAVQSVLDEIVERKLKRYGGDAHATLGAVADPAIRDAIRDVNDFDISHSVSTLPPAAGHVLVEAVSKPAEGRSRYTLTRLHAEGGIGRVWLARDEDLSRDVALKELLPHRATHPDAWRRFMKEAQITGQLEHPNIVPVYELARRPGDDQPFYTMRFVRGQTLRDAIAEYHGKVAGTLRVPSPGEPRPAPDAADASNERQRTARRSVPATESDTLAFHRLLNAFVSICHAIAYAHSRGVVHRDLKPANVVLGGFGEVLVLDWGIAKVAGTTDAESATLGFSAEAHTTATQTGALLGTPEYMAPEQAEGRAELIDARTDIYGLGGILFAILTGKAPRRGKDTIEVLSQLLDNPTPRVRSVDPAAPAALDAICGKAMAKERADRYASASELAAEVERYLADEPVATYLEPWPARLGRWMRRHRTGTQAAAVILLAVTLVSVVATVLVNKQRERANEETRRGLRLLYNANLNLAQVAWENNRVARVLELLTETRPQPGQPDLRGFEWHYWNRLAHSYQMSFDNGDVTTVVFSADGKRLASASRDGTVKVWDATSGQQTFTLKGHTGGVTSVAFSPDGTRLASASLDYSDPGKRGEVKVWDATSGQETLTLKGHTGGVTSVAFSPDGDRLASAGVDQTVKVWDATSGQETLTLKGHTGRVMSVAFSADGVRLALASGDQTVKVWDATSGQETLTLKGHTGGVTSVVFRADGKRLASASRDGTVKVWDATSGQQIFTLKGHTDLVHSVAFSADGKRLASASSDRTVKVWDATSGQEMLTLRGHKDQVSSVAFSSDGNRLVSASYDYTVMVWDATSDQESLTLKGDTGGVQSVAFSADGKRLASASENGTVKLCDATSGQETLTLKGHTGGVFTVAFSADGQRLASASGDLSVPDKPEPGELKIWDATSGQEMLTLKGHTDIVWSVAFSADGKRLASASLDGTVKVWDATSGQEMFRLKGHTRGVFGVAFSADGKRLASAGGDHMVKLWDATSGQETLTLEGHAATVSSVAFSPDGKRLASGSYDQTVKVWDATSGQETLTLKGHAGPVSSVAFSPNGNRLVSASYDHTVKVSDSDTGQELLTLKGHTGVVSSVAFSPDGQRLASASWDHTIKVWDARPWMPELRVQQDLASLVRFYSYPSYTKRPISKAELLARIRADAAVTEAWRERALKFASQLPDPEADD